MSLATWVAARLEPRRIFYGWYIVLAGASSNFLVLGITIFGFGVFFEPVRTELGWTGAAVAAGISLRSFEMGFLSPVTGYLVDRLGPRRMAITGVIILTVGLLMFAQTTELWFYFVASMIIGLGQSLGAFNSFSLAIMNWFQKKRGRAMGMMNSGTAIGYFAVPILAITVSALGWRETLVIAAAVIFSCGIPLALVLRTHPEPYGYLPDGERLETETSGPTTAARGVRSPARAVGSGTGMSVGEALRTPAFYLLALAGAAGGSTQITWVILQVPHLETTGFSLATTGLLIGIYGGVQVALRFGAGWIGDVIGRRRLYMISFLLQGVGLIIFANLSPSRLWLMPLYYLTFALGHASWLIGSMTIVADYFGTKRYATIRGLVHSLQMPASVAAPVFAGWMFDQTGSYLIPFTAMGVVSMTGVLWILLIRRPQMIAMPGPSATASPVGGRVSV